ncbi:hypothetical protein LCGC14_1571530 [marine sediment metagenome]|uniref:Uncharacterized protein n=1 Tax=marine sediment metagenome TaxID=412755 RepID=A0A0F9IJG7_9ZZZZ
MTDDIMTTAEYHESDALPRAYAIHCDPARTSAEQEPLPEGMAGSAAGKSPAQWAYQRLVLYISSFEKELDSDHEVALGLVGGAQGVMRIEGMGYFDPDIVTFYGTDPQGGRTQMIQHVSQLNVLLKTVTKQPDKAAPTRIGFRLVASLDEDGAEPAPEDMSGALRP